MVKVAQRWLVKNSGYLAWIIALLASAISLSLSEVFHLVPCVLCWYQRICMYPQTIIIGVGISRRDRAWPYTALPILAIGWVIALYHTLLQWHIIPDSLAPCQAGISCTTKQINWFGFLTIPFMSWIAFSGIIILTVIYLRSNHE